MNPIASAFTRVVFVAAAGASATAQIQAGDWLVATVKDRATVNGAPGGILVVPQSGSPWQLGGLNPDVDGSNDIADMCVGSDMALYYVVGPTHVPSPQYDASGMLRESQRGTVWRCTISGTTATATRLRPPISDLWDTPTAIATSFGHDANPGSVAASLDNDRVWYMTRARPKIMLNWVHVAGWSACGSSICQESHALTGGGDWLPTAMCTDGRTAWVGTSFPQIGGGVWKVDARIPHGNGATIQPLCALPSGVTQMSIAGDGKLVVGTMDGTASLVDPQVLSAATPLMHNGAARRHSQGNATACALNPWTRRLAVVPGVSRSLGPTGAAAVLEVWDITSTTNVTVAQSITLGTGVIPSAVAAWAQKPIEYFGTDCELGGHRPRITVSDLAVTPSNGPTLGLLDASNITIAWCRVGFSAATTTEFSPGLLPIDGASIGGQPGCWVSTSVDLPSGPWGYPSLAPVTFVLGPLSGAWSGAVLYCQWFAVWQDPANTLHFGSSDAVRIRIDP